MSRGDRSPTVSKHAFIVEILVISRRTTDTWGRTNFKVLVMVPNLGRFLMKRILCPLLREELLFISEQASANFSSEECTWVIDSGPSFHITPLKEYFSTYVVGDHGYVKMGDNRECKIARVGSVCLTTLIGCRLSLCHDITWSDCKRI